MKGRVKRYFPDKGFGFIEDLKGNEYFFHKSKWWENSNIQTGMVVRFSPEETEKGISATKISLIKNAKEEEVSFSTPTQKSERRDDRITCPGCQRKIVPRMITHRGSPEKSVCPYCATLIKSFSNCFIATEVYGDPSAREVRTLREFRDEHLKNSITGRFFIKTYYSCSPKVAQWLSTKPKMAGKVKIIISKIVTHITSKSR